MEDALRAKGRAFVREICRWNRELSDSPSEFDQGYEPTPQRPVVFHLHGCADRHESMVVTEDDYLDFLVNISKDLATNPVSPKERPVLPLRIRRAITTSNLLFIGYGLSDINFRVILRGLVHSLERSGRRIHITVQHPGDDGDDTDLRRYLDQYFGWTLDLQVCWCTTRQFTQELRRRWDIQRQS